MAFHRFMRERELSNETDLHRFGEEHRRASRSSRREEKICFDPARRGGSRVASKMWIGFLNAALVVLTAFLIPFWLHVVVSCLPLLPCCFFFLPFHSSHHLFTSIHSFDLSGLVSKRSGSEGNGPGRSVERKQSQVKPGSCHASMG